MIIRHTTAHVDNKGIIDGLCREEMKCNAPRSEGRRPVDVDLGVGAQNSFKKEYSLKWSMSGGIAQRGRSRKWRSSNDVSRKAMIRTR